jgi:GNAT superfamily N-acetyltransferase
VNFTLEGEIDILGRLYDDPHAVMMLAEVDGVIAGNCSVSGLGVKRKVRHRCSFAIALYRAFWGAGIGSAMTRYACELARRMGYDQGSVELMASDPYLTGGSVAEALQQASEQLDLAEQRMVALTRTREAYLMRVQSSITTTSGDGTIALSDELRRGDDGV